MTTHDPDGTAAVGVVVVAAGSGTRLGAGVPKAFVEVWGRSLLEHALCGVIRWGGARQVVVVAPADRVAEAEVVARRCRERAAGGEAGELLVVPGGAERTDSVAAGLATLDGALGLVLVHDAARALTPPEVFNRVVDGLRAGADAVVPGLPVVDTLKTVSGPAPGPGVAPGERVTGTPDRAGLRAVQTPQGFRRQPLVEAHAGGPGATDDAALVEARGGRVVVVTGDAAAAKVTLPADLELAADRVRRSLGPVLVSLGGRTATGKSALASALEEQVGAVRVRVDTIEAALRRSGELPEPGVAGYAVAQALAEEHLRAGRVVVADTVNPVPETRDAWCEVARRAGALLVEVEVVCSDPGEHRQRLAERTAAGGGVPGQPEPSWQEVLGREVEPWEPDLVVDTAELSPPDAAVQVQRTVLEVAGWAP